MREDFSIKVPSMRDEFKHFYPSMRDSLSILRKKIAEIALEATLSLSIKSANRFCQFNNFLYFCIWF